MLSKNKRPYDPETLEPRRRLRRNLQDLVATNSLSTQRIAEIAGDVNRVDSACFADLTRSRNKAGIQNRDVIGKFAKSTTWMPVYWAQVRCWDPKTSSVYKEWLAFDIPHEIVHALERTSVLEKLMALDGMDTLTREHLLSCELEAQCKLLGIGIWADGTPCNWDRSETVETLSMSLPGLTGDFKNMRIPITALSNKHVCHETWIDICAVLKWSLQVLATGQWPTCRHDGAPWRKSDTKRKYLGKVLGNGR